MRIRNRTESARACQALRQAAICGAALALSASATSARDLPNFDTSPSGNPLAQPLVTSNKTATGILPEGMGVMDRARPEYDATGVNLGNFILYPTVAASLSSDDNVFRVDTGEKSDLFWTLSPRLDLRSQWSEDKLQLYTQLDRYQYDDQDTESRTDWIVGGSGRLNVINGTYFDADASYFSTHESRISPDLSPLAKSPTPYAQTHGDWSVTHQPGRLALSAGVNFDRFDYDSTQLIGGGTINNDDRDEDIAEYFGKVAFEYLPDESVFVRAAYNTHNFDLTFDRDGFDRTSEGYRIDAGLDAMITPLIKVTAFAGYLNQDYKAPLKGANGLDFGAQADWFVTELTTIHLSASRQFYDTIITGASTIDDRGATLSFDHELLRNFIIQGNVGHSDQKFVGIARDDKLVSAGVGVRYLINRNMSADADYEFSDRDSDVSGKNFNDNLFTVALRLQL